MKRELVPLRYPPPVRYESAECRVCKTVGVLLGLLIVSGIVMNAPDVARYIKLKMM